MAPIHRNWLSVEFNCPGDLIMSKGSIRMIPCKFQMHRLTHHPGLRAGTKFQQNDQHHDHPGKACESKHCTLVPVGSIARSGGTRPRCRKHRRRSGSSSAMACTDRCRPVQRKLESFSEPVSGSIAKRTMGSRHAIHSFPIGCHQITIREDAAIYKDAAGRS